MPRLTRERATTIGFVALAFALAFWQHPGWATSDTKIDLHVDPGRFLSSVASVWTPTTDLGEVHSAQYSGYLWPMGPFFALLHSIGIGAWVVQRLWLGLLFALSVWGILRLLDLLVGRPRGIVHVVGALFYLLNPYTVVFSARTSITLLGYAALPWLLIVVHHGVRAVRDRRRWGGWWWAAAFALILTSIGGGVNAAVVGWMLVGPLVLLLYEPAVGAVRLRDSASFLARVGLLGILASAWWIVPLLVHVRYGIDFLQFTEQPQSIWATNSLTESLRLMGYWTSYIGVGFGVTRPFFSDSSTLLFNPAVVVASLLLPALAIAGFARSRRLGYAPFLLALVIVGGVVMMAGFPAGTPLRQVMEWLYRNVFVLRFMRTTNKAAPLVAVGVAGLLGLAAQQAWARLRRLRRPPARRVALVAAPAALVALIVLAALPLVRGRALDTQLQWKRIPAAWVDAGHGLDRQLPQNTRAMVLPGSIFAYYRWGGTLDPILPRLTDRPVAVRYETPYSDLHAVDLMTTVDSAVQQRRLLPGQLAPLLRLMGVSAVVTGTDDDPSRSGVIDPSAAAGELAWQGLATPQRSYGPRSSFPAAYGDLGAPVVLPQVRRYDLPGPPRGLVHVDPPGPATVVDGGAGGLAELAAFGQLPQRAPILYAGDLSTPALRAQAARGADVVVTDSNRRRVFLPQFPQQDLGPTLEASATVDRNSALIDPFPGAGTNGQTVAVLSGAHFLRAPTVPGFVQFPEHGPIAAFDGDLTTSWVAERYLLASKRPLEVGLYRPIDIPYIDVYPLSDSRGVVDRVTVDGRSFPVGRGWTRLPVHLHRVSIVRVGIGHVIQPRVGLGSPGGLRELRIPGVSLRQPLRAPVLVGRELAGQDLRHDGLTYLFERTTGDDPFLRDRYTASPILSHVSDRGDSEKLIDRVVFAPAARSYRVDAWVAPAVDAPDPALDRLTGMRGPWSFDSSSRFQDQARYRASSAFDADPASAWIGVWIPPDSPQPWISWTGPRPLTISRLRLTPPALPVRRPTVVALSWPGGSSGALRVAADGTVVLPRAARASSFRLTILDAQLPAGAPARAASARAVGIGTLSVPGLPSAMVPRRGPLVAACGTVAVNVAGRPVALRPQATIQQLDAGTPLPALSCGAPVAMGAGAQEIRALPGTFSVDELRLRSSAPVPAPASAGGGSVVDPGHLGNSSLSGARVSLSGPSWVVLGESFDTGWKASCDGRSLGPPQVIDGYANGWPAPAGCRRLSFAFGPQAGVRSSYVLSAVTCALLLLYLIGGVLARRRRPRAAWRPALLPDAPVRPLPFARSLLIAVAASIPLMAVFALRAGLVTVPMLALALWKGYGARTLARVAAVLLGVAVPLIYLIALPRDRGGYNFTYSVDLIAAHWVGVAAVVLLALAGWQMVAGARGRAPAPQPSPGEPPEDPADPSEHELELAGAEVR
jgi:hypothetical protein